MMDLPHVELSILDNVDAEPRCARVPCEGVATLGEFRALLEEKLILWPFDFYDAKRKSRIATEFEQISRLESYKHEVTVIRSDGRQAMAKKRKRVDEAVLEPTTVKVVPEAGPVYSADDNHEGSPHASTVSKAPAGCEDEHEDARSEPVDCKDEPEEDSCPKLAPKHKVFLSHSGDEKPFVGKLCKLLEACDHFPFFDQRQDSLPKGKKFARLIIEAAQKCQVAVVVLSEGYLSSKWPMIELAEFVRARKSGNKNLDLLPLFYKVSAADLDDESIKYKWMPKWKRYDGRVDPEEWAEAVRELRGMNGLSFDKFVNKESYRNAIVEAIFKLAPPDLLYDMSKIHGGDRICKILTDKFKQHPRRFASALGLHGMGGLGKTTISKCLCNHFNQEFLGRVCYIEMQDGKDALMRQKIVMRKLLRLCEEVEPMKNIFDASQGWNILKSRMRENPVFPVIDNIGPDEEGEEEALEYLNIEYNAQSKIVVVARSSTIVERLLGDGRYCCEIPCLERNEAIGILLQQGGQNLEYSSLSEDERGIVEGFVVEACFPDQNLIQTTWCENGGVQYHPLALRALGVYLRKKSKTCGVLSWATYKDEYKELKATGEPYNKLFKILGLQFSTLDKKKQMMYLDIVLYGPCVLKPRVHPRLEDMEMWLANIHDVTIVVVKHWISYFREIALLNIETGNIIVHDLYKEYAKWSLKNVGNSGELVGVWCNVPLTERTTIREELQKLPLGNCWQQLRRIGLQHLSFHDFVAKKFQEWQNVVVLQIIECAHVTTLNFEGLTCLRHLELRNLTHLRTVNLIGDGSTSHDNVPQACYMEPKYYSPRLWLQFVILDTLPSLEFHSFSPFISLKYLAIADCNLREPPRVQYCSRLEKMHLYWNPEQKTLPNLDGLMSLRDLTIRAASNKRQHEALKLEGLSSLISLQALELACIPVGDLNGLENLTSVEFIFLHGLYRLEDLPPLESLANSTLHELHVEDSGEHKRRLSLELLHSLIRQKRKRMEAQGKCVPHFSKWRDEGEIVFLLNYRLHSLVENIVRGMLSTLKNTLTILLKR